MNQKKTREIYEKFKKYCKEKRATLPINGEIGFFSTSTGKAYLLIGENKILVHDTRTTNNPADVEFKEIGTNGDLEDGSKKKEIQNI